MVHQSKTVLVTGGSKGIGRAVLEKFVSEGFDVITCSRSEENLTILKSDLLKINSKAQIDILSVDLANADERKHFAEYLQDKSIDVLVNNTGVFIPGKLQEEEDGILEKTIETNVYSAYHVTRAVVPQMKLKKEGSIFNICSTASVMAYENGGSYCISKFALLGFSKVLRQELKEENIKVVSVLPGPTITDSWAGVEIPEERFMPPEDIAQSIWDVYSLSSRTVVEEIVLRPQLGDL